MSSFLVPLIDALAPQSLGAELPDPSTGLPAAFGAGTPFFELFPQLLAELAASPDGLPPAPVPDFDSTPTQTEFPAAKAGGRLCQPTAMPERIGSEHPAENPDTLPAWTVLAAAGFLHAPAPLWTVPSLPALGESSSIGMAETSEESSPHEEESAKFTSSSAKPGSLVLVQPTLFVPAEHLPVAGWTPVAPTIVDIARSGSLPEVQVDVPEHPTPLLAEKGINKETDTESGAPEAEAFPDLSPPPAPPPILKPPPIETPSVVTTPEVLPARPTEPSIPATRGLQEVSLQPGDRRPLDPGQDETGQLRPKDYLPASSEDRDRPAAREAFRLLLRNHTNNAPAEQKIPIQQELSPRDVPSTETTPNAPKLPAPLREWTEGSAVLQTNSEPVRPPVTKILTRATESRSDMGQKSSEESPDRPRAAQTQSSGTQHEPRSFLPPDSERRQGDRKSLGREEDGSVGSSPKPESAVKPVVLPAREFSAVHEERHVALRPDAGAESPHAASAVDDRAPLVPPSRTVQQLRVTLPPSAEGRNVELLLNQRAGGVEVSVRSPDPLVRETLRSGLSELIGAFDRKGVAAEALPITVSGHSLQAGQTHGLTEAGAVKGLSVHAETTDSEMRDDPQQNQQRQAQWEPEGDNRRRRDQPADAWQKYMEEYAWRSL